MKRISLRLNFFLAAILCAPAAGQQTEAKFRLTAKPGVDGADGSEARPFTKSALNLLLEVGDATPSSYAWGRWQASFAQPSPDFERCPGAFQFFEIENRDFFLKYPRIGRGRALIRVAGIAQEGGFPLRGVSASFHASAHPDGCQASGRTERGATVEALPGSPARLSAAALSGWDNELTFVFSASTAGGSPAVIDAAAAAGCNSAPGCAVAAEWDPPKPGQWRILLEARGKFEQYRAETVVEIPPATEPEEPQEGPSCAEVAEQVRRLCSRWPDGR